MLVPTPLVGAGAFATAALWGQQNFIPDAVKDGQGQTIALNTSADWPLFAVAQKNAMIKERGQVPPPSGVVFTPMPKMTGKDAQKIMTWWAGKAQKWDMRLRASAKQPVNTIIPTVVNPFQIVTDWALGAATGSDDAINNMSPLVTLTRAMAAANPFSAMQWEREGELTTWPEAIKLDHPTAEKFWKAIYKTAAAIDALESFGPGDDDWVDAGNIMGLTLSATAGTVKQIIQDSVEYGVGAVGSTVWWLLMTIVGPLGLVAGGFLLWWAVF